MKLVYFKALCWRRRHTWIRCSNWRERRIKPMKRTSYDAEYQLLQRIRQITAERRHLRMRLGAMGIYTTDAHANFIFLPSRGGQGRPWSDVFADSGLHIRHYADGAARITVGSRESSLAVLAALSASGTPGATTTS